MEVLLVEVVKLAVVDVERDVEELDIEVEVEILVLVLEVLVEMEVEVEEETLVDDVEVD